MSKSSLKIAVASLLFAFGLIACQSTPPAVMETSQKETPADGKTSVEQKPDPQHELYTLAIDSAKGGDVEDAIRHLQELVVLNPEFDHVYTNLGLLYLQKNEQEKAKQAFNNAIMQDKSNAIAYNHLAIIQRQEGLFKPALENYTRAIEADPEYANAHLNLGILLDIYLQDLPRALEHYLMFQRLSDTQDEQVEKWVIDIKRRIDG